MKDAQINLRLTQEDLGALQSVARALGLDMSNTLRFLVYEKQRELTVARPAGGKKRRSSAA